MRHRFAVLLAASLLVVVVIVGLPVGLYISSRVENHHTCVKVNAVREQVLKLIDEGVARSKAAAAAPTATPVQKFNYKRAEASAKVIHAGLALDKC
jgi:hypothetical protein